MDLRNHLKNFLSRRPLLRMAQPAGWWRDGFPLGNGTLGAMPYGRLCEERILINHERLWYNGVRPTLPDLSGLLGECRRLIEKGSFAAANELYWNALEEQGGEGRCAVYHPAADLCLRSTSESRFKNYQRFLDMASGEALTYWEWNDEPQVRRVLVSRSDDCIVVEQLGGGLDQQPWELTLELHELVDAIRTDGELFEPPIEFAANADDPWITGIGRYTDPTYKNAEYGVVARVIAAEDATIESNGSATGLIVHDTNRLLIIAKVFVYEPAETAIKRLKSELATLSPDYDTLREQHVAKHRPMFESCRILFSDTTNVDATNEELLQAAYSGNMPVALLQKMTDYGRYLLLTSANRHSLPSNLQGIWNGDYAPPWDCFFMINENLQMNYWQALPGGLNDKALGVFRFYESNLADYRENARKLFGCRGIFIPSLTSPETGLSTHKGSWIVNWISGAGWLCQHFYDYYLFTGDETFLSDRLLPFMKEVALFYEDYFEYDADEKVVIAPSVSPENWPREFCNIHSDTSIHPRLTVNATMDVAIARELLGNLLQGARDCGLYSEHWEKWECMLEGLPAYEVNDDGAVREWLDHRFSDNYEHRHLSHIYPVFPGFEISRESHPAIFESFQIAVDKRRTVGLKAQSGWSLAHMANIEARMGYGEGAMECLETLAQTCVGKNLFTYHNDYRGSGITIERQFGRSAPFQIDANMGLTAAVYEMLIQSRPGSIKLLPAMPAALRSGKAFGLQTRAGVAVDMEWQLEPMAIQATFCSQRDQTIEVQVSQGIGGNPAEPSSTVCSSALPLKAGIATTCKWTTVCNELIVTN